MANIQVFASKTAQSKVHEIRGQRVMLDRDVATALEVETKQLNQNAARSPKWEYLREKGIEAEFRFQLTKDDVARLGSHIATSIYSNTYPYAYTRKGCAYFGTSMENPLACEQAVQLVEVFDKVQKILNHEWTPDLMMRRHAAIMDSVKFLATIPGYNPTAIAVYVEHSMKDIQGTAITERTLLDISAYLMERGMKATEARKSCSVFGKQLKKTYIRKFQEDPPKAYRMVDNAERFVYSYTETHRDLFDEVWDMFYSDEVGEDL